ncbi:AAA family ATPase [Zoogloea sp.]|uniref:AAA family ATPase n=1 Tax=Zoogloea sp. TaxID=49181 RepID=UPI0035AFC143
MTQPKSPFVGLQAGTITRLDKTEAYSQSWHQWSQPEIDALTLAYAAGRPLLVRGEPGTGKTQLARAAAQALGWKLHAETIHPRFEPHELRFRFDAIKRLADAQAQVGGKGAEALNDRLYWRPGVLWKAYGWASATRFMSAEEGNGEVKGHVVLIDEIDKADSDLPNSLLEVLAQRSFHVEPVAAPIGGPGVQAPLIVITTNEERDLPAAFLRRCIVLSLAADSAYAGWLVARGKAHFGALENIDGRAQPLLHDDVLWQAAEQLVKDRDAVAGHNLAKPGLAEYLDLLYALHALFKDEPDATTRTAAQLKWLDRLSAYGYLKHAVEDPASAAHQPAQASQRSQRAAGEPR